MFRAVCCKPQHGNKDYRTVSNYFYDLIISSYGEWNSCCWGFVSVALVVILLWKWSTLKAVILLSVCWQTAWQRCWNVIAGFIDWMVVCFKCVSVQTCMSVCLQVTTWCLHLNLQKGSHFIDLNSRSAGRQCCTAPDHNTAAWSTFFLW